MITITRNWIKEKWKNFRDNLFNHKTNPHDIAFAYALGIFVGVLPGIDLLLGFLILLLFRINKVALIAGMATVNPFTAPLVYGVSFAIGKSLVGYTPLEDVSRFSTENILNISRPLIVGNLVLAVIAAFFAYVLVYTFAYFFVFIKHKRQDEKLEKEFEKFEDKNKDQKK